MPPTMYPYLSYRDATAALAFLQEAFGFAVAVRWDDPDGTVQHAEATFGEGAVMMGTAEPPARRWRAAASARASTCTWTT